MGQALSQAATGEETEEVWLRCTARGDCQNFRLTQTLRVLSMGALSRRT
jgi:hypothetical protein